jgi:hypothetical protein
MSHIRKQIRDNVVTTLTGLTTTGTRVYKTRVYPIAANKLPGLAIYTRSEESESATLTRPRLRLRVLDLVVEGYAATNTNLDDELDKIAAEVEAKMALDVTRNNLAKDTELVSTEIDQAGEGETQAGVVRMVFRVQYHTLETNAETAV